MEVLASGNEEYKMPDPDGFREWVRTHKQRELVNKVMSEKEAVERFVSDGDYICWDWMWPHKGPNSLIREIIRQKKKHFWAGVRLDTFSTALLVAAGCIDKIDLGFTTIFGTLEQAVREGKVKIIEWSNTCMVLRYVAGSMGITFLPINFITGTDLFQYSGSKLVKDPFTGRSTCLIPALNPDVSIIHVNQCDIHGNARVFGPNPGTKELAAASKKLILSTEELIPEDEIRKEPVRTNIPYYLVDAIVVAPFGAYPGSMPGHYDADIEGIMAALGAQRDFTMDDYMEKEIYSVESHEEFLEKRVGIKKLLQLKNQETIREGYYKL